MSFNPLKINKRRLSACALLLCFAAFAAFSFIRGKAEHSEPVKSDSVGVSVPNPVQTNPAARLEAQRITLRSTGFEPNEITRPAGRFLLAVNNRSGQQDVTFLLQRDSGGRVYESRERERPRKHEWRQLVNLPPGNYLLKVATHPEWICRITLTAN